MATALTKRPLGAAGIQVTELGFGGAGLGNLYREVSADAAVEALDAAWGRGVRFFDTAPYYGFGLSEVRLGDHLRGFDRNSFVLSTKVGRLLTPAERIDGCALRHGFRSPMPFEPVYDYSYDGVMRSFEASLERLGLERIDLLLLHDIGEATHGPNHPAVFAEAMDGWLSGLGRTARRRVGAGRRRRRQRVGGLQPSDGARAISTASCWPAATPFWSRARWTASCQDAKRRGVAVIVGGPYNSGILATGVDGGRPPYYNYAPAPKPIIERVRRIQGFCREFDVHLAAAALQFPLAHPVVASVIPGLASSGDVDQALAFYRHPIPAPFGKRCGMQGWCIPKPRCQANRRLPHEPGH